MIKVRRCHHPSQLPLPLASFGDALPVMAVSYVSAVVHQPQIASSVVQAVAVYMTHSSPSCILLPKMRSRISRCSVMRLLPLRRAA